MTRREARDRQTGVTAEDAFGTPPAARGNVMNVAGKEDELEPGDELLTDDSGLTDDETMPGPIYQEGTRVMISIGMLRRLIRSTR